METINLGAGLAALAFWGFIGAIVVAVTWDGIRKRDAQHETMRRLIESGQAIDEELMQKLSLVADSGSKRVDRDFYVTGMWLLPVSIGLAIFSVFMGKISPQALNAMLGAAGLVGCLGIGALIAGKITGRWYRAEGDSTD